MCSRSYFFFFQAEDGIRDKLVTGVQTCALPILPHNLYLHSSIVQTRRYDETAAGKREAVRYAFLDSTIALTFALRSEEHTSELQSLAYLVCRLLLEKKKKIHYSKIICSLELYID